MTSWDKTPWMIGGGAVHTTNVARLLAFVAFGGMEGIINPLDLEVRARAVPAGSVRIAPGACAVLNRNSTVQYESYAARLPIEDVVDIPPTGSGSARTDLVVVRVKNPFLTGEPFPEPSKADMAAGAVEFVETHVITNVSGVTPGTHPTPAQARASMGSGMSGIPLASIAIPASTGTVTAGMIQDLRSIAQFRETQQMRVVNPTATLTLSGTTNRTLIRTTVRIPDWATHWTAVGQLAGVSRPSGALAGQARVALGSSMQGEPVTVNESGTSAERFTMMAGDNDFFIPSALRGTNQNLDLQFQRSSGVETATVNQFSSGRLDIVFQSLPEKR